MEHDTDRLFWAVAVILIGALLLTIGIKTFPNAVQETLAPISGVSRQSDSVVTGAQNAAKAVENKSNESANVKTADELNFIVDDNGDGTGNLMGFKDSNKFPGGTLTIPEYIKVNGKVLKIVSIGSNQYISGWDSQTLVLNDGTTINVGDCGIPETYDEGINNDEYQKLPQSVRAKVSQSQIKGVDNSGGNGSFTNINSITSLNMPDSIKYIGFNAFANTNLSNIHWSKNLQIIESAAFAGAINMNGQAFYLPRNIKAFSSTPATSYTFGDMKNTNEIYIPKSDTNLNPQMFSNSLSGPSLQIVHVNKDFYNQHVNDYFNPNNFYGNIGVTSNTQYIFDQN